MKKLLLALMLISLSGCYIVPYRDHDDGYWRDRDHHHYWDYRDRDYRRHHDDRDGRYGGTYPYRDGYR